MSVRRFHAEQPDSFVFTKENQAWAHQQIAKYPQGKQQSAIVPLLWQAQKQLGGWLCVAAIHYVADMVDMPYMRALEVATFYTMFNLSPTGEHFVQLCGTTPCWLRGADDLKAVCRDMIGAQGEVTADGKLSWQEVECLGACVNAPMVQINDDFYEDLTAETFRALLAALRDGKKAIPGPQNSRIASEPEGGRTVLKEKRDVAG